VFPYISSEEHYAHSKETYKRDDIVQKRPIILRSLLIVALLYIKQRALHSLKRKTLCIPTYVRGESEVKGLQGCLFCKETYAHSKEAYMETSHPITDIKPANENLY